MSRFLIEPKCSPGKVLDVDGENTQNGANIHIWEFGQGIHQYFKITDAGDSYVFIESCKCLSSADLFRFRVFLDSCMLTLNKERVDNEYANGRVTVMTDNELVREIDKVSKELGIVVKEGEIVGAV